MTRKAKQEKLSAVDFNKKYFNNPDACEDSVEQLKKVTVPKLVL